MAILSPEAEIRYNENLFLFFSTDLLLVSGKKKLIGKYARFRIAELGLVGLLAAAGMLIQPLWPFWCMALAPVAAVAIRNANSIRQ
jgi:hypothetical protein